MFYASNRALYVIHLRSAVRPSAIRGGPASFCFAHLPPAIPALLPNQPPEPVSGAGILVS